MIPNPAIIPPSIRLTEDDLAQARLRAVADFDRVGEGKAMGQYHLSRLEAAGLGTEAQLRGRYPAARGFGLWFRGREADAGSFYRDDSGRVFDGTVQLAHLPTVARRMEARGLDGGRAEAAVACYAARFIGPGDEGPEGFDFALLQALLKDEGPAAPLPPAPERVRQVLADYASGQPVRLFDLSRREPETARLLARTVGVTGLLTLHAGWYQFPHHRTQTPQAEDFAAPELMALYRLGAGYDPARLPGLVADAVRQAAGDGPVSLAPAQRAEAREDWQQRAARHLQQMVMKAR